MTQTTKYIHSVGQEDEWGVCQCKTCYKTHGGNLTAVECSTKQCHCCEMAEDAKQRLFKLQRGEPLKPEHVYFYLRKKDYGWLSNFWRADQVINHQLYQTNEHYYQSQKARERNVATWIMLAPSPFLAMKAGRSLRPQELKPDWEDIKANVMLAGLRAKFSQNATLAKKLIDTGTAHIHEESTTDAFWGMNGQDMLGKLLMRVRDEIRRNPPALTTLVETTF